MPSDTPKILILPRTIPIEITNAKTSIECAIPVPKINSFNQSMFFCPCYKGLLYVYEKPKMCFKMLYKNKLNKGERKIFNYNTLILYT